MLKHPTLDLLGQLGLAGMAKAFADLATNDEAASLSHAEWLALLLDHEATWRNDRRMSLRLRQARLRHHLLEILEDRYGQRSTVVTSQRPIARWHELIGDPTYADAILDRLVHNAYRLEMAGESMRKPTPNTAALPPLKRLRQYTAIWLMPRAEIARNAGRLQIGIGGRHRRNPQISPRKYRHLKSLTARSILDQPPNLGCRKIFATEPFQEPLPHTDVCLMVRHRRAQTVSKCRYFTLPNGRQGLDMLQALTLK